VLYSLGSSQTIQTVLTIETIQTIQMQTCGVCKAQSPDGAKTCPRCGADLSKDSVIARALARMQANKRVTMIRISVAADACPACKAAQGAHSRQAVPRLPIEGCSHALGCRCYYEPVLAELYP